MKAIILSCSGLVLTDEEKALFAQTNPLGFILFKRNIDNPDQLATLIADLRDSVGWHCPVLIDQEGGRVQRMRPPHWHECKAAKAHESVDEVRGTMRIIAGDLTSAGFDVNCAPVLDVGCADTHDAIGDRAFSHDPLDVFEKGKVVAEELLAAGITPVIKHMPGQGRANLDSHLDLPVVDVSLDELRRTDFVPFQKMSALDIAPALWGLPAHVIFPALDPDHPVTLSEKALTMIRAETGFEGLLISDDISMGALKTYGKVAERVGKALASGIDIGLYCAGNLDEMQEIAAIAPPMSDAALERYERSQEHKSRLRGRSAA